MSESARPRFDVRWERGVADRSGDRLTLLIRIFAPVPGSFTSRSPIDVAFALDRSGSMSGEPIHLARQAVVAGATSLQARDRLAVVAYDHVSELVHPLQPATQPARQELQRALDGVEARGSTNLCDGWLTACRQLAIGGDGHQPGNRIQRTLLLTDGLANVGVTEIGDLVRHAHELRTRGIATTTLGFGDGFDEALLSSMAEAGGGNFQYIPTAADLPAFFARELGEMVATTMARLHLFITLPNGIHGRVVSQLPCHRSKKTLDLAVGEVTAGDELSVVLDIEFAKPLIDRAANLNISAEWFDPLTDSVQNVALPIEPLNLGSSADVARAATDQVVAEEGALQRAARDQREAMRLDREGRFAESRRMHYAAQTVLAAAPQTGTVSERLNEATRFARYSDTHAFGEDVRKQNVHDAMRRGRGHRDDR